MAHGDYTGNQKATLAHAFQQQQQLAAQQMSLVTQVVEEGRKETIDLFTEADHEALALAKQPRAEGDGVDELLGDPSIYEAVKFRASETLDDITVGKDRHISLKTGQVYRAPKWVVTHLDDKQLVWH